MTIISHALTHAASRLREAGVDTAALDVRLLLRHVLGCTAEALIMYPDAVLEDGQEAVFDALVERRTAREPLAQIVGQKEFWGLNFKVTRDVLTPRPDSETLVRAVLESVADRKKPVRILDLGTGSGCLLLALLSELPMAYGMGVDISEAALALARENAETLGFLGRTRFMNSDWCEALDEKKYEIVVANPPYIASNGLHHLMPEVAIYEPPAALDGGEDGLGSYRRIATQLPAWLTGRATVAMEVGIGQHDAVARIFTDAGLTVEAMKHDYSGIVRCVVATMDQQQS